MSSGRILDFGLVDDIIAEVATELLRGSQINPYSAEQFGELVLDFGHVEKRRAGLRHELDQQVHVSSGPLAFRTGKSKRINRVGGGRPNRFRTANLVDAKQQQHAD